ncbi:MFS general substrate transporter [Nemania sp. FL0916]|nr:MFS general substrate transporter [Nemania sp. FL0916]
MEATMFQALVQVESNSLPQAPRRAVSRTYPAVPQHEGIELKSMPTASAARLVSPTSSGPSTPCEERDLEMSVSSTPGGPETSGSGEPASPDANTFEVLPSLTDPPRNKFRFAACCTQTLLSGLTDSAPGALIPYIEKYYHIGYAVVSLIFISNAFGYIAIAPFTDTIRLRLGRAKTLFLANMCITIGFIPLLVAAPFQAVVIGYFFIGVGFAVNLAISNVFTANLQNGTVLLGTMHGTYGVGGTIGPLIATSIVSTQGPSAWNRYYILTIALALATAVFFLWSFWGYESEHEVETDNTNTTTSTSPSSTAAATENNAPSPLTRSPSAPSLTRPELSGMLRAFRSRVVLLGATFIFAYQGAEVSISGWVISFLIAARGGNPKAVGNVTSGFWGGITLGRFLLSPVGARWGEKRFVFGLTGGAAVFQLLVWLVPNIIGEAVSLAVVGLLLGPIYPCAATVFTRNLSRREQVSGLGVITAFGSSGGAIAPFATGLLAQAVGTFVLHPIAISLFAAMVVCWLAFPAERKRSD